MMQMAGDGRRRIGRGQAGLYQAPDVVLVLIKA
jgi:hypothetical protein